MSDMGLETPDADSAEQKQNAVAEPEDDQTAAPEEPPLEANEADAAEQDQLLDTGEDEYR